MGQPAFCSTHTATRLVRSWNHWVCPDCDQAERFPEPTRYSLTPAEIEAELRAAWFEGKHGLVLGGYKEQEAACHAYITRALDRLEKEKT